MSWPHDDPIIAAQPGWFVVKFDFGFKRNDVGIPTAKLSPSQIAKFDIAGALERREIFAWQLMLNDSGGVRYHPLGMTGDLPESMDGDWAILGPDGTVWADQKRMPLASWVEAVREQWRKLNDQIPEKPSRRRASADYLP